MPPTASASNTAPTHGKVVLAVLAIVLGITLGAPAQADKAERVARGEYLVGLLACTRCHTTGALSQNPREGMYLAGSDVGIAYTNYIEGEDPGVVFPPNLTSDVDTGLGNWSTPEIVRAIREGIDKHGVQQVAVMPWAGYAYLEDEDAVSIANYLQSLPPVKHRVPKPVKPGNPSQYDYVRFGIYQFKATPR